MTYSHNINPNMPICRYEATGGICNDSSCDSQHFRSMGLSGALKNRVDLRALPPLLHKLSPLIVLMVSITTFLLLFDCPSADTGS